MLAARIATRFGGFPARAGLPASMAPIRAFRASAAPMLRTSELSKPPSRVSRLAFEDAPLAVERSHTVGQLFLAGSGIVGLGALAYYGVGLSRDGSSISEQSKLWRPIVRQRVRDTYMYIGGGLALTGVSAVALYRSGVAHRMMARSPWLFLGVSLAGSVGSMVLARSLPMENWLPKHLAWAGFNTFTGLSLAPLMVLGGPLVLRAAMMTGAVVGGLTLVAVTAPSDKFLYMGGVLGMGLGVVVVSSLGTMFLPASSALGSVLHSVSLYGGTALFGGLLLLDTQRLVASAQTAATFDPISSGIGVYLDVINLFVRIAEIMAMGGGNRRR